MISRFSEDIHRRKGKANRPEHLKIPSRYSRHYYDIYCMSQTMVKKEAFKQLDLLKKVVAFKMKFYPRGWARYSEAIPSFAPVPYSGKELYPKFRKKL